MPPTKRTSTGASGGGQNKKQRTSNDQQPEEGQGRRSDAPDQQSACRLFAFPPDAGKGREPFGYYCIPLPCSEFEAKCNDKGGKSGGDEDDDDDDDDGDDAANDEYKKQFGNDNLLKPAAEVPDHKWIATWEAWKFVTDYKHRANFVDPDNFAMIFNDFAGYDIQELVENMLLAFDKHSKKKNRSEETVKLMWSTAAAVGHLLLLLDTEPWLHADDAERIGATVGAIGNMALTALNELDRADLLKADSPIQDLGLVMAIFACWGKDMEDYAFDGEGTSWVPKVAGQAARANIDLRQMPVHAVGKLLDRLSGEGNEPPAALECLGWT